MTRSVRLITLLVGLLALAALHVGAVAASPPVGEFSVSPAVPTVGETMTLDARGAAPADPDGTAYTYEWDTGDGIPKIGAVQDVAVLDPPDHHTRRIVLRVTDPAFPDDPTIVSKDVEIDHKPSAEFARSPEGTLHSNDTATFTDQSADLDGDIEHWTWRVDGVDKGSGQDTTHELQYKFPAPGRYAVTLTVRDRHGHVGTTAPAHIVEVASQPPIAKFTVSPAEPAAGQEVELDAHESFDPDGSDVTYAWDVDGDDKFDDGTDPTSPLLTTTFPSAGERTVKLRVTDGTDSDVATRTVTVKPKANVAPTAGFTYAPADPTAGQAVTFTSTSSDSDGSIAKYFWDVDNDGRFNEGGASLTTTFARAGAQTVTLKVVDDAGGAATTFRTVTVRVAPTVTPPPPPPPPPGDKTKRASTPTPLNPFPIVRMRGLILRRRVNIQILSVRAESGAVVTVRCIGRGCPVKRVRVRLKGKRRAVRIHRLERSLRVGTVLEIRITKKNRIGKYTRFVIRRNAAPSRRDLCIGPASRRPVRCTS